jgi:hypothetical protein
VAKRVHPDIAYPFRSTRTFGIFSIVQQTFDSVVHRLASASACSSVPPKRVRLSRCRAAFSSHRNERSAEAEGGAESSWAIPSMFESRHAPVTQANIKRYFYAEPVAYRRRYESPASQSVQHRVGPRLSQLQPPEEFDFGNRFVELQANDVMLVCQLDAVLLIEFATLWHSRNLRHRAIRPRINVIRNEHRLTVDNSPNRSRISPLTL